MKGRVTFTVFLYNKKMSEDLGIDLNDDIEAKSTVKLDSIALIRECANNEGLYNDRCTVELINGDSFQVKGTYDSTLEVLTANGW
jgi:hypothetical protein